MTGQGGLFGDETTPTGRRHRPAYVVEIVGLPVDGGASTEVRVKLVDQEHGRVMGAKKVPFDWLRDVATGGTCTLVIHEGDYS